MNTTFTLNSNSQAMNHEIDIEKVPQPDRHRLIFETFDKVLLHEAVVLNINHDPKPLYFQFLFERSGQFSWDKTSMPDGTFRIEITRINKPGGDQRSAEDMSGCSCKHGKDDVN